MNKLAFSTLTAVALFAAPAFAQDTQRNQQQPAPQQQAGATMAMTDQQIGNLWRASRLDDVDVYNNNNEKIGDVSDILLDRNGKAVAVVLEVGGFLGIGSHRVALKFEDVKFSDAPRSGGMASRDTGDRTAATTTTGAANRNANAPAGAPPTNVSADRDRTSLTAGSGTRMGPDHAIVNMTKDQLKALPQISYTR